ncbi:MAG: ABC transporter ATP-binding protein/permease [Eubacterium sp.]|nr:ABC transporter ATP-binding protein/permease [Eubacterium sp.]
MIDKRLSKMLSGNNKYIALNVLCNWVGLLCNIAVIFTLASLLQKLLDDVLAAGDIQSALIVIVSALAIRFVMTCLASKMSYRASTDVKRVLREKIYQKLLKLGMSYNTKISTAEVVQISVEGVEQLDIYFSKYLPQLFYSLAAPLTLFALLSSVSLKTSLVLLICVPLIPVSIVLVQKFAKKLLSKYWGVYTELGDSFLENLQGLTTLKIYEADASKNDEMNVQAERFRKITMKVLTMQLNSVTVMDIIAFGGAAIGIVLAVTELAAGRINAAGAFALIMLSAEFFIPLRLLGSFFHIAMNGMAASDKIFNLLNLEEPAPKSGRIDPEATEIALEDICFSYDGSRQILADVNLTIPTNSFTAFVGASGSGKSTITSLIMGQQTDYTGTITVGGTDLKDIAEDSIMENITRIGHNSMIFKGTVRDNLKIGDPTADDATMEDALKRVNLYDFLMAQQGLDTEVLAQGANFSGGQCQRLALARALLHDSPVYIFDEATSNIDAESENHIMAVIKELTQTKTVVLISHRLANVVDADNIYVLDQGGIVEAGSHTALMDRQGVYANLYTTQKDLENYGRKENLQ